jgi:hypothetical protein
LIDDFKYLAELAGKAEEAKQFDEMIKTAGGLEGIDKKKPIALYGHLGANGVDSQVVAMLPVADEKSFVAMLEKFGVASEKGKDGVYTATNDQLKQTQQTISFRFANGYVYASNDVKNIAKDKLLTPAQVLPTDKLSTFSLVLSIDQMPAHLKDMALGQSELQLGNIKDEKLPDETDAQHAFRIAAMDESTGLLKTLLTDGQDLSLSFDIDRKTEDISLALTLTGKSGSTLATNIADLGKMKSIGAGLIGNDSALNFLVHLSTTEKLRKALEPVIDEGLKKALDEEKDQTKRDLAGKFFKVIAPTLKTGELDLGVNLRGPNANGLYAGVFALKVKDGKGLEKAIKDLVKDAPAEDKKDLTLDFDRVKNVDIHKVKPGKDYSEEAKKMFGDNPVYFAFRDDAVFLSMGEGGLGAIKEAITGDPKPSKAIQMEMAMGRLIKLGGADQAAAIAAAKKAFAKNKNGDRITISLEGGQSFKLRASMKAQLVTFFALVAEAEQKKKGNPQ